MNYKNSKSIKIIRFVSTILLLGYLTFILWRMFFYAYGNYYRIRNEDFMYNLVPFRTISNIIMDLQHNGLAFSTYNIIGNICVFIPLGLLLYIVINKANAYDTLFISFCIILLAETMQLVLRLGVFDVDDIILNLIGVYLGVFICREIKKLLFKRTITNHLNN